MLQGTQAIYEQAFDVLTSSKLLTALDITREDPKILKRYGIGKPRHRRFLEKRGRRPADLERADSPLPATD